MDGSCTGRVSKQVRQSLIPVGTSGRQHRRGTSEFPPDGLRIFTCQLRKVLGQGQLQAWSILQALLACWACGSGGWRRASGSGEASFWLEAKGFECSGSPRLFLPI